MGICIDVEDPDADKLNDISDVEKVKPGFLDATREWFKIYKVPDGKPLNNFAFDGAYKDKAFAEKFIHETHGFWKAAIGGEKGTKRLLSKEDAEKVVAAQPEFGAPEEITDMKAQ